MTSLWGLNELFHRKSLQHCCASDCASMFCLAQEELHFSVSTVANETTPCPSLPAAAHSCICDSSPVLTSHIPGQKTTSFLTVSTQILGFLLSCSDLGQMYTLNKITEIGDEPTESEAVSSLPTTQGRWVLWRKIRALCREKGKYVPGRRASPIRWQTLSTDQVVYTSVLIHFCALSSFPQYPHAENP